MATRSAKIDQKADLIWAIADKLTGVYKPHEYGDVILPLTVIRRFDCILSDTKDAVLQKYDEVKNLPMKDILLRKASKKDFYNSGHDTRVLLLSATPYKLYSTLEEIDENQLDEHYAEFFQVMNFLFDDEVKDIKFKEVWKNYSHALSELKAGDSAIIRMKELAENAMYQGVSRTERISVMDSGDYTDDSSVKHHLQIDENDINSYIQMSRLLSKTDSNHSLPVDYAKSCPYLMSFMKKYITSNDS